MKITLLLLMLISSGLTAAHSQTGTTVSDTAVGEAPRCAARGGASVGGYVEMNASSFIDNGLSGGFTLQMRRLNICVSATVTEHLRLLAELEFEDGGRLFGLEIAMAEYDLNRNLSARAGIILTPLGRFNPAHDGPLWEFVERPFVSTRIIPTTHNELAFGFHGLFEIGESTLNWEAYIVNGLGDGVIDNDHGRASIPGGKSVDLFNKDNNGMPAFTGRASIGHRLEWDIGLSYYGGVYNKYRLEDGTADPKRMLSITALDFGTGISGVSVQGELAYAAIDLPPGLPETFAERQWGAFVEFRLPLFRPALSSMPEAVVNFALRLEYADLNARKFSYGGSDIMDDMRGINSALSFRPAHGTVIRANYLHRWHRDPPGTPSETSGFQLGFSTFF